MWNFKQTQINVNLNVNFSLLMNISINSGACSKNKLIYDKSREIYQNALVFFVFFFIIEFYTTLPFSRRSACLLKTSINEVSRSTACNRDNNFSSCLHAFSWAYRPEGICLCCPKPEIKAVSLWKKCVHK